MSEPQCTNCGCTDFAETGGFFVCSNCYTQSQDIRVQAFDDEGIGGNAFNRSQDHDADRSVVHSRSTIAQDSFTSWECYNVVLKGLVEELIQLGASSQLKVVSFQLWATYLQRAGIAFISKSSEKIPALPLGFKIKDARILHDVPNLRKVMFEKAREESPPQSDMEEDDFSDVSSRTSNVSRRSLKLKQRKMLLAEAKSQGDEISDVDMQSVADESLTLSDSRPKAARIRFNKNVEPVLDKIKKIVKRVKRLKNNERELKKMKMTIANLTYNSKRCAKMDGCRLYNASTNIVTLISIIRVALLLLGDDILLDDILRWICDGKLSANQPEKFMPDFDRHVKKNDLVCVNRNGFQLSIKNFTLNMDLCDIPTPNLLKLAERYCADFHLPKEFTELVVKLICISKPRMDYAKYKFRLFPDYECRVMAFILYAFKLLFSLDDSTEYELTDFADAVNECIERASINQIRQLFSWSKWVRYIECRKAVLSAFNPALNQLFYNDKADNRSVLLGYWDRIKPAYVVRSHKAMDDDVVNAMKTEVADLLKEVENDCPALNIDFPASFTPYATSIAYLMSEHANLLPQRCRETLQEDYSQSNVDYALDTDFCESLANKFNLKVEINEKRRPQTKFYKYSPSELLEFSRSSAPTAMMLADVTVERKPPAPKNKPPKRKTQRCEKEMVHLMRSKSQSRDEERKFSITNSSSQYWMFHDFHKKITVEEFETLIDENLPKSFLWLLDECVARLRTDRKTLYSELIFIEAMLCMTNADHLYDRQIPMKIMKHEW